MNKHTVQRFYYYCLANTCYFLGDLFSKFDNFFQDSEWFCRLWYTPYNYFMNKSVAIDSAYKFGMWKTEAEWKADD